jgi:hypothetical protein
MEMDKIFDLLANRTQISIRDYAGKWLGEYVGSKGETNDVFIGMKE